ncbi:DNA-3-methyladenine glycosylase [bacterium]|nr:DNA-3-methyladenine glycosylase [bacterium]
MEFLNRPVWEAAPALLGWRVCRRLGDVVWKLPIVETEAYASNQDGASHAWRGPTARNRPMFGPAGRSYVYFIYGMYHCLNVVAHAPEAAGAVLIRALDHPQCNGPGKLCRFLKIDRELTDIDLLASELLWLEPGKPEGTVQSGLRVGIRKSVELPWRFWIGENRHVSRGPVKPPQPRV